MLHPAQLAIANWPFPTAAASPPTPSQPTAEPEPPTRGITLNIQEKARRSPLLQQHTPDPPPQTQLSKLSDSHLDTLDPHTHASRRPVTGMGVQRRNANKLLVAESDAQAAAVQRSTGAPAPASREPRHPAVQVLITFTLACGFWVLMQLLFRWQRL
ncbi:MAG: hypothetical protein WDW38_000755 [Sanguina aurantia]